VWRFLLLLRLPREDLLLAPRSAEESLVLIVYIAKGGTWERMRKRTSKFLGDGENRPNAP
jgi:hypothetical protein